MRRGEDSLFDMKLRRLMESLVRCKILKKITRKKGKLLKSRN